MNSEKYKFSHELPKDKNSLYGKVSSPLCLAELLTELLGINQAPAGKIVYDCCVGVGALSSQIDTQKHILLGDDREQEYLKIGQQNKPAAILFHHDTFACQKMVPCFEHLASKKWKVKVATEIKRREAKLNEADIRAECRRIMATGLTEEQIKEELIQKEAELKQKTLEYLIQQAAQQKVKDYDL
jgi:hypothetical protein